MPLGNTATLCGDLRREDTIGRSEKKLEHLNVALTVIVLSGLALGAGLRLFNLESAAAVVWAAITAIVLIPLTCSILVALRKGRVGVDVIALLAIVGSLVLGEYLAGAVIALMLAGGNALEEFAQTRASNALHMLIARMPHEVHVRRDGQITEVSASDVAIGDVIVVRAGEVVAVDGTLVSDTATIDEATLTGEPLPQTKSRSDRILSGSANAGNAFDIRAVRVVADSAYSNIIRLVQEATTKRAPLIRLADRYALFFLPFTVVIAGLTWALSADPIRALAVLVVATPCPLILAPPVALVAGTSRAARKGCIIKDAAVVERLGKAHCVLIDKTGTLTLGIPAVEHVQVTQQTSLTEEEVLFLAGSLEQMSVHTLAEAIAHKAAETATLVVPEAVSEVPGRGIQGTVGGRHVAVGGVSYLHKIGIEVSETRSEVNYPNNMAIVHVAIDQEMVGLIALNDAIRSSAASAIERLDGLGIRRIAMLTGDTQTAADAVASQLGITRVYADCTPESKMETLLELRQQRELRNIVMVGDGINDAPALAAADIGIAMGGNGATAATEAADVVIVSGSIDAVADAIAIGTRSRSVALQSIVVGMCLSVAAMFVASAGYIPPVQGALLQEVVDVAVILNALRALR